jgi:hypothetical protein
VAPVSETSRIWRIGHGIENQKECGAGAMGTCAVKKAIERAGSEERPKILDLDF